MINLNLSYIKDNSVKEAFEMLLLQLNSLELLKGDWDCIEYVFINNGTTTTHQINHRLKFKPIDIIILYQDSTLSDVVFNIDKFTPTTVSAIPTGFGKIRFLVGKQNRGV
ncbi:MAG: hypothetical protein ACK41T_00670 [Pseudobdellovibrio sp.]